MHLKPRKPPSEASRHDDAARVEADNAARMLADDVSQLEALQAMALTFATWLHDQGAEQMENSGEAAVIRVQELSNSFNKAAQAVRRIVVLKHEVAGLRPTPHARAAGPANQNTGSRHGDGSSYDARSSHDDRERRDCDNFVSPEEEALLEAYLQKLVDAVEIDIQAAGPEKVAEAAGQSAAVKLTVIAASIPHPTLEKTIAGLEMNNLWELFAPRYAEKPPGIGPPE
jgi:hypothetical protein